MPILPNNQLEFPVLLFVPVAARPVTGHNQKETSSILSTPSRQIFIYIKDVSSHYSLFQAKQTQFSHSIFWFCHYSFTLKYLKPSNPTSTSILVVSVSAICLRIFKKGQLSFSQILAMKNSMLTPCFTSRGIVVCSCPPTTALRYTSSQVKRKGRIKGIK